MKSCRLNVLFCTWEYFSPIYRHEFCEFVISKAVYQWAIIWKNFSNASFFWILTINDVSECKIRDFLLDFRSFLAGFWKSIRFGLGLTVGEETTEFFVSWPSDSWIIHFAIWSIYIYVSVYMILCLYNELVRANTEVDVCFLSREVFDGVIQEQLFASSSLLSFFFSLFSLLRQFLSILQFSVYLFIESPLSHPDIFSLFKINFHFLKIYFIYLFPFFFLLPLKLYSPLMLMQC